MFLATIPAVLYVDRFGRKTILIVGGIGMAISHYIAAVSHSVHGNQSQPVAEVATGRLDPRGLSRLRNLADFAFFQGITGAFGDNWPAHRAGGWVCVVFVWLYAIHFGYSWGPIAWVVVSEVVGLNESILFRPHLLTSLLVSAGHSRKGR